MEYQKYNYSSVELLIEGDLKDEIINYNKTKLNENDLINKKIEYNPHITIKYGILSNYTPEYLYEVAKDFDFIDVFFGSTSKFDNNEESVLKIDIISKSLFELNSKISKNIEVINTYPEYIPHLTLAYIKPMEINKYINDDYFIGKKIRFNKFIFSGYDGVYQEIIKFGIN